MSLKAQLRQNILPKVQMVTCRLPKDFSRFSEISIFYLQVKAVLAVFFLRQHAEGFRTISCHDVKKEYHVVLSEHQLHPMLI